MTKPRIRRWLGLWWCEGNKHSAPGHTPLEAYRAWKRKESRVRKPAAR